VGGRAVMSKGGGDAYKIRLSEKRMMGQASVGPDKAKS